MPEPPTWRSSNDIWTRPRCIRRYGPWVRNEKILGDVSARTLQSTLKGHTFRITRRHGKNLFA
jgi:hypothetical protein